MKAGDKVRTGGYDVVAVAGYDRGDLVLMHNNSTHYLLVDVEAGYKQGSDVEAEVLQTFQYHPSHFKTSQILLPRAERAGAPRGRVVALTRRREGARMKTKRQKPTAPRVTLATAIRTTDNLGDSPLAQRIRCAALYAR